MENAPFNASRTENEDGPGHQLHISFTEAFRALDIGAQGDAMAAYIADLHQQSHAAEAGSREQMGMLIVLQLTEQMLPHIQAGEMDIDQTIVAEIDPEPGMDDSKPLWHQLHS